MRVRTANGAYTIGCGPPIGLLEQGWWLAICDTAQNTGVRIYHRAAKRLQPQPIPGRRQHRNETSPEGGHPRNVTLENVGTCCRPLVAAYGKCSCINPEDLPFRLWLRALQTWTACFIV
jgi:hypothetical protein